MFLNGYKKKQDIQHILGEQMNSWHTNLSACLFKSWATGPHNLKSQSQDDPPLTFQ